VEMVALAASSGIDLADLYRLTMLPELMQAGCTMFGAWGSATPNGQLIQVRSLDWNTGFALQDEPTIVVYHPLNATYGHAFANIGWAGFVGSVTGFSSASVSISEKVGDNNTIFQTSRIGIPFLFMLRDILMWDNNIDEAYNRMENDKRTCSIYVGVGSATDGQFRLFEYDALKVDMYDPTDSPFLPHFTDIVYRGINQDCLVQQLTQYQGNLTAANIVTHILSIVQTGNLHAAVYDYGAGAVYVANAKADSESGLPNAYDRQFVRFDTASLFAEQPPAPYVPGN